MFAAAPIPIVGFAHQPQRRHVADASPDDAALLGRQQQVQRARVFGGVLRVVAREPHDGHHRQLTLHFGQPPLVRCQESRGPIDRLRQQFLIDRPPARIECARADALGDIELILLDQRAHAFPHRDAVIGQQRLSQRDASFTGRVGRVGEQLPRFTRNSVGLLGGGAPVLRQRRIAAELRVVGPPCKLRCLPFEPLVVAAVRQREGHIEAQPIGNVGTCMAAHELRHVGRRFRFSAADLSEQLPVFDVCGQRMIGKARSRLREALAIADSNRIARAQKRLVGGGQFGCRRRWRTSRCSYCTHWCKSDCCQRIDCKSNFHRTRIRSCGARTKPVIATDAQRLFMA